LGVWEFSILTKGKSVLHLGRHGTRGYRKFIFAEVLMTGAEMALKQTNKHRT
jgi:hypothetical protein